MIEVYSGQDSIRHPALFAQMFRQRHDIYVKRRGWELQTRNGLEQDEYDTPDTRYLMIVDDADRILGSLRLLPTVGPHLFADKFAHLADDRGPRRDARTLELTRFYVAPFGASKQLRQYLIGVLSAGMLEYCLANRVIRVVSVIDRFLLPLMRSMGWPVRVLSRPYRYGQGIAIGVEITVTQAALETTRESKGVIGCVLSTDEHPLERLSPDVRRFGVSAVPHLGTPLAEDYPLFGSLPALADVRRAALTPTR